MPNRLWLPAVIGALALILAGTGCDLDHHGHPTWSSRNRGSGDLTTESRDVTGFTSISVEGAARLIVDRTGTESLTITAEDNILPYLRAEVVDDRLVLGPRPGVQISPTREILYRVTCRELTGVFVSGASHAQVTGLDNDVFVVELSGASVVAASGRTDSQLVQISGASQYHATDLSSRTAVIGLSGVSRGTVRVSDGLVVTASGGSVLEYFGNPSLTVSLSGGSLVTRIGG